MMSIANLRKNTNTGEGANANANSKADMMNFLGPDTLAELVWSPKTGINIKFTKKEPCFMYDAGPSETGFLDTPSEQHIVSLATHDVSDEVIKSSSCTGSQNQGAADALFQQLYENGLTSNVNDSGSESRPCLKTEPMMKCGPREQIERDNIELDDVKMEKDDCCSDPFLENAQAAIFEDEKKESCKISKFFTKRKIKCSLEQQLLLGNKRIKKQEDEYTTKTDSSFMNWISNMLKGYKSDDSCDQRINVYNETRSLASKETGFHNVFQPLFSPEAITRIRNKSVSSMVLTKRCSQESLDYMETENIKAKSLVKQVNLNEVVSNEAPKGIFDTIRRLRLSRTDIYKWMNSQLTVSQLDGFFLRLRVTKREDEGGGSRYYVACIEGLQRETKFKDLKQPIRVKVGGVECFVESQHVSNCDFKEEELIAWWQKTSKSERIPVVKDLPSKLTVRRTLGI
ncbi:hypothetical protein R6Q57_025029 [Mikania cordata]